MKNILLIEAKSSLDQFVDLSFRRSKYMIHRRTLAQVDHSTLSHPSVHLIIVDFESASRETLEGIAKKLKEKNGPTPVLAIASADNVQLAQELLGSLDFDFLLTPISPLELKTRGKLLMKKASEKSDPFLLRSAGLILDIASRQVYRGERAIPLRQNEFELLEFLMRNAGRVITKAQILEKVWNYQFDPQTNVVDVLIFRLREKMDKQFGQQLIQTVRGVGYRLLIN